MGSATSGDKKMTSWTTGHCSTGKRSFTTRKAGKLASKSAGKSGLGHMRVYMCHECGTFHIGHLKKID